MAQTRLAQARLAQQRVAHSRVAQTRKTTNNSNKKDKHTKKVTVWDEEYFDIFTFKVKPVSDHFLEKVAEGMRKWADLESSFRISDFHLDRGISKRDFYRWVKRDKNMETAHEYAMARIASRREKGALFNELNTSMVIKTLGHYCEIYSNEEQKRSDQRQKETSETQPITVIMKEIPSLDRTPEKP